MRIAVISDIHSNYLALERVLYDIKKQSIDKTYCLGDLVGYAPYPDKIFPMLKNPNNGIMTIMGNYDEAVAYGKDDCGCGYSDETSRCMGDISYEWTLRNISQENKEWIKKLLIELRLEVNEKSILMVHGSPEEISERVDLMNDEQIIEIMWEAKTDILFCAHTHLPYHKIIGKKHVINPGSVGRPRIGSPQASYAIVNLDSDECKTNFRLLDYDYETFAREIENSDMPKNNFAEVIRTGYWKF